jgi:hypothetical protein
MCRLYSSLKSCLEFPTSNPAAPSRAPNHAVVQIRVDFVNVAFNKDAFPNRRCFSPADQSFNLPKQAQL